MGSQHDTGKEIVVVSKSGRELTLTVRRVDAKMGQLGGTAGVEFLLERLHTVRFRREVGLISRTITLYVDGKQMLKRELFLPFDRIEFPFEIEGIDCEFVYQSFAVGVDVNVYVGGNQVFVG